ncbi:hypothetical protein ACWC2T_33940 [Streptomyces sp. NPDC001393]
MPEPYEPRLPLFTLTEAHQLLDVLQHFGTTDHDWGARARHFLGLGGAGGDGHHAADDAPPGGPAGDLRTAHGPA